jgi:hypothetical protein
MTDRDKSILEEPEKMCEYCCNFDREHIGMDGTALCKLTMTLAYAEDYGGNCMFYNVPKEQIIVPPCKVGDMIYTVGVFTGQIIPSEVESIDVGGNDMFLHCANKTFVSVEYQLGKTVFLTKEDAEEKLKELKENGKN